MTPIPDSNVALAPLATLVGAFNAKKTIIDGHADFIQHAEVELSAFAENGDIQTDDALLKILAKRLRIELLAPRVDQMRSALAEIESELAAEAANVASQVSKELWKLFYGYVEIAAQHMRPHMLSLVSARWAGMKSPAALAVNTRKAELAALKSSKAPGAALALACYCQTTLKAVLDEVIEVEKALGKDIPSEDEMRKTK